MSASRGCMQGMSNSWGVEIDALLGPQSRGLVRVLGGPGTGKSTMLVDTAIAHLESGATPESVLLLSGSGALGISARGALMSALLGAAGITPPGTAVREPLVRTVHAYAYSVLRRAAERADGPPPRLLTSAEQDVVIRELLAGDLAEGAHSASRWSAELRPALSTSGFATELRNLMARCAERGVDPLGLVRLGRRCGRPEWTAAGRFAQQYEQVMLLRAAVGTAQATAPALAAGELVGAALEAFAVDPGLLADERARIRLLLVDDAQQLDPQATRLVRALAAGTALTVVAGDPHQAVFGFRGGVGTGLLAEDTRVVRLEQSHRCAPAVARAISAVAARLPGSSAGKHLEGIGSGTGEVTVRLADSPNSEAAAIADALRRAHLIDGLPWSQMAVIVRSVPQTAARLSRALTASGVPVAVPSTGRTMAQEPAAQALLTALAAIADGLTGERALALITGPVGRVDPVSLRQLRRALRRGRGDADSADLLLEALSGDTEPSGPHARALRRVRAMLAAARRSNDDGGDPSLTLWEVWNRSGLQRRWLEAAQRGGPAGAQAERDLAAVAALFDIAEQYTSRTSGASLKGLLDHVAALHLPGSATDPVASVEQVRVLSAHAALGHEWEFVVIAGLQEGLWPNVVPRGGVLGTQRLLDEIDGIDVQASARAPLLAEERRLLIAAMGRAKSRLLITAVDGEQVGDGGDDLPSSFFYELAGCCTEESAMAAEKPLPAPQVLSVAALVGRLRAVVCAPEQDVDEGLRQTAATQLARLAESGVPGADPAGWHGILPVSSTATLRADGDVATLSPSTLQALTECPLRWLAERHGGGNVRGVASVIGSLLHALFAESGRDETTLMAELERLWRQLPVESQWYSDNELDRHRLMVEAFTAWRSRTRGQLTEVGVEVELEGEIDGVGQRPVEVADEAAGQGTRAAAEETEAVHLDGGRIRLRGRMDRLERDAAGRLVVVDIKTGKTPVTKDKAQQNPQLALYQLAVAEGMVAAGDVPGGARLVYVAKKATGGATEREQDPLTPHTLEHWRAVIRQAAEDSAGPDFVARPNENCARCPMRPCCPAHIMDAAP